ncbi:unnamed protein product, partial [Mesorhabditis belari]|uniref:Hexosyltransferase n=1 Tax=Mesorhabditis belari TaxID=2138241 RepID=A0AAF3FI43_9BILA
MRISLQRIARRHPFLFWALLILFAYIAYKTSGFEDFIAADSFDDFRWPPYVDVKQKIRDNPPSYEAITRITGVKLAENSPKIYCSQYQLEGPTLRIFVKSSFSNFEARLMIRSTWGSDAKRAGAEVIFVTGLPVSTQVISFKEPWPANDMRNIESLRKLWQEGDEKRDLLIGNFVDSYRNNTRKFVLSLAAAAGLLSNCEATDFALFLDDDYLLNVPLLVSLIRSLNKDDPLYSGWKFDSSPFRMFWNKHAVPLEVYPFDRYPEYISAGAVLLSSNTIHKFAAAIPFVRLYLMDDIYAGILAYSIAVSPKHDPRFEFWARNIEKDEWQGIIAAHGYPPAQLDRTYKTHLKLA